MSFNISSSQTTDQTQLQPNASHQIPNRESQQPDLHRFPLHQTAFHRVKLESGDQFDWTHHNFRSVYHTSDCYQSLQIELV